MTDQVDAYLEHFGVKGMRWGKRRSATAVEASPNKSKKAKVKAVAISAAALGVVGAVVVMKALDKNGNVSASSLSNKPVVDLGKRLTDSQASTRFDAKVKFDPTSFDLPKKDSLFGSLSSKLDEHGGPSKPSAPKPATAPKATAPKASAPKASAPPSKPRPPSQYPTTPLIPTPILDEIMRKYGL